MFNVFSKLTIFKLQPTGPLILYFVIISDLTIVKSRQIQLQIFFYYLSKSQTKDFFKPHTSKLYFHVFEPHSPSFIFIFLSLAPLSLIFASLFFTFPSFVLTFLSLVFIYLSLILSSLTLLAFYTSLTLIPLY